MSRFARILQILKMSQEILAIALVTIDLVRPMATSVFESQETPSPKPLSKLPEPVVKKRSEMIDSLIVELKAAVELPTEEDPDSDLFQRR